MCPFDHQALLVTGTASSLRHALMLAWMQEGVSVEPGNLERVRMHGGEVVDQIRKVGGKAIFVAADVAAVKHLVDMIGGD